MPVLIYGRHISTGAGPDSPCDIEVGLKQLNGLEGAGLAEALVLSKFSLIWLDRFGDADNGERMISSLIAIGAKDILPGMSPRYVARDLGGGRAFAAIIRS